MIIKRKKGFFYLQHSYRKDGKIRTKDMYIGKVLPQDIDEMKENLLRSCLEDGAFARLDQIKRKFNEEWRKYPESIKKKILLDLSISFTYNTNAIEGSTISEDETDDLIRRRLSPNKPIGDVKETLNHSRVFLDIINRNEQLTFRNVLMWHKSLFSDTKPDIAGKLRDYLVRVGDYRAPDWQDLDMLLKAYFSWFDENKAMHPVELAARAHYRFEKIHPFGDGNGRIGRLIIALALRNSSCPILVVPYKKRKSYYHALSRTENDFLLYFIRTYLSVFKRYLR
jgi:Fic family protein